MTEAGFGSARRRIALVTGATGFVGSHLAARLVQDGWQVHVVVRASSHLPPMAEFSHVVSHVYDGSMDSMIRCVGQAKPDVVFHLASLFLSQHATKDVDALIQSNVLFGSQLLEAMKVNGVRCLVNTGTSWQHYNNEDYNPVCLYAATKQAFEAIMEYYVQAGNLDAVTLKLFDTYGPGDSRQKLFYLLNRAATNAEPLDMSGGEQLIDLVHIDDVLDAYLIAAHRVMNGQVPRHECYAVSSGHPLPLREVVRLYAEVTHQPITVNWGARAYRDREVMVPWHKGPALAGWSPKIGIREGLSSVFSGKPRPERDGS